MRLTLIFILSTLLPSSAYGLPAVYVLPVQSEVPFLTQLPGTNIFVGPGASSIFKGKVIINGNAMEKFPEPPINPPEWANGLKARIERAVRARSDLRLATKEQEGQFLLRVIVTRFGESEEGAGGVTFEGAILDARTKEVQFLVNGSASAPELDEEEESLSWPDFTASESQSAIGAATREAAANLAENVAARLKQAH